MTAPQIHFDNNTSEFSGPISPAEGPVTGVIRRTVRHGKEGEFEEWLKGVVGDAARFPGNLGTNIMRPASKARPEYIIIFRFDTYQHLQDWETSEVRHRWVERVQPLISGETQIHHLTGLEYWFTVPDHQEGHPPPRYKMALVTWLALAPVVMLVQPLLLPRLDALPPWLRTVIMAGVMVLVMTWLVMPVMTRVFKFWLFKANSTG